MVIDKQISIRSNETLSLHVRHWPAVNGSTGETFVLLHGLASNARTWDGVAVVLANHGHTVFAVDQRGHGLSDKPDASYDFDTMTSDLTALLDTLAVKNPVVAGQSWGANVVLAFAATYPERAKSVGFIDGGYLDLQMRPDSTWQTISRDLKPPPLTGMPASDMAARMRQAHPDWSDTGIDGTMANFKVRSDGTIQPWLSLEHHMRILRALWEQRPATLYPEVRVPVYIAAAEDLRNPSWMAIKQKQVAMAEAGLSSVHVERFPSTDHDIHVQRPERLAHSLMTQLTDGI